MKRSALFCHHQRAGAIFGESHGWQLPEAFTTPEAEEAHVEKFVGLADLSYRAKFETSSEPATHGWRLAEGRYLVIGDPPVEAPSGAIEITSVYANVLLAGPTSRDVMSKLSSLNTSDASLPNRSCGQAGVGHIHAIVLRDDLPRVPAYHILITRDYAESFWEAVMHAGEEFGIRPFGWSALARLRG